MCYWKQWRYARDQSPQPPQTENFQETGHYDSDQPQRALASCQDPGYTKRYDQRAVQGLLELSGSNPLQPIVNPSIILCNFMNNLLKH